MPASRPPIADATSSSMPSRRLIRLRPAVSGRDRARGRDHRHQADGRRDLEVEAEPGVEERHEKHAAADAEQRSEPAGDAARQRRRRQRWPGSWSLRADCADAMILRTRKQLMLSHVPAVLRRRARAGSFLVGCDRTNQAVVIDPRRDASVYAEAARQAGATIVAAIETHVHADFVSGAHEFAARGVRVRCRARRRRSSFAHHEVTDGETLVVGDLALTFLHTPGHTPEHICMLAERPSQPRAALHRRSAVRRRRRTSRSARRRADARARRPAVRLAPARADARRRRRSASGTWRRLALRRRHRQGALYDDRSRAATESDAAVRDARGVRRAPCSPIFPRRRPTSRA